MGRRSTLVEVMHAADVSVDNARKCANCDARRGRLESGWYCLKPECAIAAMGLQRARIPDRIVKQVAGAEENHRDTEGHEDTESQKGVEGSGLSGSEHRESRRSDIDICLPHLVRGGPYVIRVIAYVIFQEMLVPWISANTRGSPESKSTWRHGIGRLIRLKASGTL